MAETPEIDTDGLRETIDREIERDGGRLLRLIALSTALFAATAAIAALKAGSTVNEALVLKTESTRLQAQASDQWAYYQAKAVKAAITLGSENTWVALGKAPPASLAAKAAKYASDETAIAVRARALETERDQRSAEADHLLHRHHLFAQSVALFQVAIALGAIAALTRKRLVWIGSMALGAIGCGFLALALLAV
jgi:hypothetical protein